MKKENIKKIANHATKAIALKKQKNSQQFIHEWRMRNRLTPKVVLSLIKEAGYSIPVVEKHSGKQKNTLRHKSSDSTSTV